MTFTPSAMGVIFLFQTALGILGNSACLSQLFLADVTGRRAKPTDLVIKHLTWANLVVLLSKGIPHTMAAFGHIDFLDNISCKLLFYFYRVARGVSLSSTTLLSVIQAITISPNSSKWVEFKGKVPKIIGSGLGLCWVMNLLVYVFIPMIVSDVEHAKNLTGFRDFAYCVISGSHSLTDILSAVLLTSVDVMCEALMAWASGSMVLVLWKHRKRVQHIHSSLSARSSPETRATQRILVLVSSFVFFYVTSSVLTMCYLFFDLNPIWLINANVAMSACFPVFCPFLLLSHLSSVSSVCSASHKTAQ